jgi:hypothetical protein
MSILRYTPASLLNRHINRRSMYPATNSAQGESASDLRLGYETEETISYLGFL